MVPRPCPPRSAALGDDSARWHKGQADEALLKKMIEDHHRWTGSLRARDILDHWADSRAKFVKVFPHEYRRALEERSAQRESEATISKARATPLGAQPGTVPAK